jgi:hypothetical protein
MKTRKFNVEVKLRSEYTAKEDVDWMNNAIAEALAADDVENLSVKSSLVSEEKIEITYPEDGAEYINRVAIKFSKLGSISSVESIIDYWAALPYVGKVTDIAWSTRSKTCTIDLDVNESKSSNINARNILETLCTFLTEGTPKRKTQGNTRAFNGLGDVVISIEGVE